MASRVALGSNAKGLHIEVQGLTELRRDLRTAGEKGINRRLTTQLKKAAEIVAADARSRVPTGPDRGGHVRTSIKAAASQRGAFVQGGKNEFPYYGWLDFGSRTPNKGTFDGQSRSARRALARSVSGQRVGPWAASGPGPKGGRFIYPAIEANGAEVVRLTAVAVDQALKESNL